MKALILGAVGEMCTPATKDLVKRKIFSDVTLADININKLMKLAKELKVSKDKVMQQIYCLQKRNYSMKSAITIQISLST